MKIERLAAIAEIVSSIAIVVTLGYLAVQTQQNTAAIVSNSRQQTLDAELDFAGFDPGFVEEVERIVASIPE